MVRTSDTHTHTHIYVYIHVCIYIYKYIYLCISIYIEIHAFTLSPISVLITNTPKFTDTRHNHFVMLRDSLSSLDPHGGWGAGIACLHATTSGPLAEKTHGLGMGRHKVPHQLKAGSVMRCLWSARLLLGAGCQLGPQLGLLPGYLHVTVSPCREGFLTSWWLCPRTCPGTWQDITSILMLLVNGGRAQTLFGLGAVEWHRVVIDSSSQ